MNSKFNLGGYLKNVFAKKKKNDLPEQIETKLIEKNKNEEEPQELTEKLLKKDRTETEETLIEKKLEKVRAGSQEMLVEGQLNKSKSSIVTHRNVDTARGNINKLEEQRLKGETMESEKYESASEIYKPKRFWKNKSPDGLKLAKNIKIAQAVLNYDINTVDNLPRETVDFRERLSPGALMKIHEMDQQVKQMEEEESPEQRQKVIEDIINDPETLSEIFSETVIGQDDSSGTKLEERKIIFDLKNPDGEIKDVFRKDKDNIDKNILKKAIIKFINLNHTNDIVGEDALSIDFDKANIAGSATYIIPV